MRSIIGIPFFHADDTEAKFASSINKLDTVSGFYLYVKRILYIIPERS